MTSRQRVLLTLDHKTPDRVPIDLGGFQTGIHRRAYEALIEHLGIHDEITMLDPVQQLAAPCEEVLRRFEGLRDMVRLGNFFADPVIVALCLARSRADVENDYFVVADETLRGPGSLRIPNLCQAFGLAAIKLMDLFRREGLSF